MLNNTGERPHPCLTPLFMCIGSDIPSLNLINLTKFQNGVYYSAIRIFNNLPHNIKGLGNKTVLFQNSLKRFLLINSFYNSEEYFNYQTYSIEN